MIDWDAIKVVADRYGISMEVLYRCSVAVYDYEQRHLGIGGQVVHPMELRHVQVAFEVLKASGFKNREN